MGQPTIRTSRPFTIREALLHVLRRWWLVGLIGVGGSAAVFFGRGVFEPHYQSEVAFRVMPKLAAPRTDANIQLPADPAPEPLQLAAMLRERALSNNSLDRLFAKHKELFADSIATPKKRRKLLKFIRKYATIKPSTNVLFAVKARAHSPEQAQALADWIVAQSVEAHRRSIRSRADALAKFTRDKATDARRKLEGHEDQMVAFLRQHPQLLVSALQRDRRLATSGPDRMRVRATQRLLKRTGVTLGSKDPALKALLERRNRLRRELRSLDQDGGGGGSVAQSKLRALTTARQNLNQLKAQGLSDNHPSVKRARRRIQQLEQAIARIDPSKGSSVSKLETRIRSQLKQLDKQIRKRMRAKQTTSSKLPALEAKWGARVREQQLLLSRYDSLQRLAAASSLSSRLGAFQQRQLAASQGPASLPLKPKGLKRWMVVVAGAMISFLLGLGLTLSLGAFDRRLYAADEVETLLHLPLLARLHPQSTKALAQTIGTDATTDQMIGWSQQEDEVEVGVRADGRAPEDDTFNPAESLIGDGGVLSLPPHESGPGTALATADSVVLGDLLAEDDTVPLRIKTVVASAPSNLGLFIATDSRGQGADQMRLLAGRLTEARAAPCHVILVASWEAEVGRSTITANLAMAFAESRRRTLVIDTCGGNAALTRIFGLRPDPGTTLYEQLQRRLEGQADSWTLYKVAESLTVLPSASRRRPMVPMLSSQAFNELIGQLEGIFDVVLLDSSALADAADAVVLNQHADAVLTVLCRKRSTLKGAAELIERLDRAPIVGAVFNER